MKKNNKGSAIIIGVFLLVVLTLTMYILLEYIVPFSRETQGIQNSSKSYYMAYAGVENSLINLKEGGSLTNAMDLSSSVDYSFSATASGTIVPSSGKGNSNNRNYSKISAGNPIQLTLPTDLTNLPNARICFKVPDLDGSTTISFNGSEDIIFWSLTSESEVLNGTSLITGSDILDSRTDCTSSNGFIIYNKNGKQLTGGIKNFSNFYNANCDGSYSCTLRLSVINSLKVGGGAGYTIPYLDYQIRMGGEIPLYYTTIESTGKSYGYQKDLEVQIPRKTLNQAFDFTIFQ